MGKNKSGDVFSFFLFEETGDSEAALGVNDPGKHVVPVDDDEDGNNDHNNRKKDIEDDDDDDDDDAGSCCYDSSYSGSNNNPHNNDEYDECDCDAENEEEAAFDEGYIKKQLKIRHENWENEHYTDTASTMDLSGGFFKNSFSCISVVDTDRHTEPLTEAEKNRRFWEACLAS